jgi:hypothetical protein
VDRNRPDDPIADKLSNAIAALVLPFSVNNADSNLPRTIGQKKAFAVTLEWLVRGTTIRVQLTNVPLQRCGAE